MNYDVITIDIFDKQAKRLIKKFPSLKKIVSADILIKNGTKSRHSIDKKLF